MKKLLMTCAVAAVSAVAFGAAGAQPATQGMSSPQNQTMPQTAPSSPTTGQTMQGQGMNGQSMQGSGSQATDLTGQTIYSASGHKIGTVASMTVGSDGQQEAVVSVQRFMGMGGKSVMLPVSSLQARNKGGYTTSLSATEIKALPEYKGGGSD